MYEMKFEYIKYGGVGLGVGGVGFGVLLIINWKKKNSLINYRSKQQNWNKKIYGGVGNGVGGVGTTGLGVGGLGCNNRKKIKIQRFTFLFWKK